MSKKALCGFLCALMLFSTGCDTGNAVVERINKGKEECIVNRKNATEFEYKGNNYIILNDTKSNHDVGKCVGYIQKMMLLDSANKCLQDWKLKSITDDIKKNKNKDRSKGEYLVTFMNVYESTDEALYVNVNGDNHRAVKEDKLKSNDQVIQYEKVKEESEADDTFRISDENCTQIVSGNSVFQITKKQVDNSKVGDYVGVLAQVKVFNAETCKEISKKELMKIEAEPGKLANTKRERWMYGQIRTIQGEKEKNKLAVEVNNKYYIAEKSN